MGASEAVGDVEVSAVCTGAGPRRTSVDRPQVSAVGELVPGDGGRDSCRSRTGATIDAGGPRADRLLHPAFGVADLRAPASAEVDGTFQGSGNTYDALFRYRSANHHRQLI